MSNGKLDEADVRAMVRLVGEAASRGSSHLAARRHLMEGLKKLIDADCWVWSLGYLESEKPPVYVSIQHEGFDEDRFTQFLQAVEHPEMTALTAPFAAEVMKSPRIQVTRLRQEMDPENRLATTDANVFWQAANIYPVMLSAHPLDERCVSIIGVYRRLDQPLFAERERQIAHILMTEVPWLHANGWPHDFGVETPTLPRSRRLVLNLLLEGHSRKQVADKLDLSLHTVSGYIKDIYRTFKVHSHAELMRRFAKMEAAK